MIDCALRIAYCDLVRGTAYLTGACESPYSYWVVATCRCARGRPVTRARFAFVAIAGAGGRGYRICIGTREYRTLDIWPPR